MCEFDVFLSHNSKDKANVRRLARALEDAGLRVWLDEEQLIPGRPWQEALESIIGTTKAAAVIVGRDGIGPWEQPELRALLSQFVRRQLPVIPVLLPGVQGQPELPVFLQQFQWVDLRQGLTQRRLDRLKWGITGQAPQDGTRGSPTPDRTSRPQDDSGVTKEITQPELSSGHKKVPITKVRLKGRSRGPITALVAAAMICVVLLIWGVLRGHQHLEVRDWLGPLINALVLIVLAIIGRVAIKKAEPEDIAEEGTEEKPLRKWRMVRNLWFVVFAVSVGSAFWIARQIWVQPSVQITDVPTAGEGGPDLTQEICGIVRGVDPQEFRIVLFAETNLWFVQPYTYSPITGIDRQRKWCNKTHLGHRYAALLVKPDYVPPEVSESLPQIGANVVASTTVDGRQVTIKNKHEGTR